MCEYVQHVNSEAEDIIVPV